MLRVVKSELTNGGGSVAVRRFVFEFDNGSYLPINTYQLGLTTYIIADDSEGINIEDNSYYIYKNGKWNLSHNEIPTSYNDTTITNNGTHSVSNNDIVGYNDVEVDIPSDAPTLIEKTITENGEYSAEDDGADGYSSVDVNVSVTGIPKLVSPSSLVEALKSYKCAIIHNKGETSITVVKEETWVSAPSVIKCYGVATSPIEEILFTNDKQYCRDCTIIFTANSDNIVAKYFNGTMWNTINWGRSFTASKVYRADFEIEIVQGNVASVVVNTVTEYDEPISFTVE